MQLALFRASSFWGTPYNSERCHLLTANIWPHERTWQKACHPAACRGCVLFSARLDFRLHSSRSNHYFPKSQAWNSSNTHTTGSGFYCLLFSFQVLHQQRLSTHSRKTSKAEHPRCVCRISGRLCQGERLHYKQVIKHLMYLPPKIPPHPSTRSFAFCFRWSHWLWGTPSQRNWDRLIELIRQWRIRWNRRLCRKRQCLLSCLQRGVCGELNCVANQLQSGMAHYPQKQMVILKNCACSVTSPFNPQQRLMPAF